MAPTSWDSCVRCHQCRKHMYMNPKMLGPALSNCHFRWSYIKQLYNRAMRSAVSMVAESCAICLTWPEAAPCGERRLERLLLIALYTYMYRIEGSIAHMRRVFFCSVFPVASGINNHTLAQCTNDDILYFSKLNRGCAHIATNQTRFLLNVCLFIPPARRRFCDDTGLFFTASLCFCTRDL